MVGRDVTNRTRLTGTHLQRLVAAVGPQTDVVVRPLTGLGKFGGGGVPTHDPLAVGVAIDCGVIRTQEMRIEVETRGVEFTRGATVATRGLPQFEERDGRLALVGFTLAVPNAKVAAGVEAKRFLELFITRLAGR
jgi:purine nucleosidase